MFAGRNYYLGITPGRESITFERPPLTVRILLCLAANRKERNTLIGEFVSDGKTVKKGTDLSLIVVRFYLDSPEREVKKEAASRYAKVLRAAALERIPAGGLTRTLRKKGIRAIIRDFDNSLGEKGSTAKKTLTLMCSDRWLKKWHKITGPEAVIRVELGKNRKGKVTKIREGKQHLQPDIAEAGLLGSHPTVPKQ